MCPLKDSDAERIKQEGAATHRLHDNANLPIRTVWMRADQVWVDWILMKCSSVSDISYLILTFPLITRVPVGVSQDRNTNIG